MALELTDSTRTRADHSGYRAVIFDLDGVLVDSFDVMRQAFTTAYAEVVGPGPAPFAEYSRHLGRYFPDIMQIMGLPGELEAPFVRESARLAGQVRMFDGVADTVRALRERGARTAVATGKSTVRAVALLERLGLLAEFDHVIGSDQVEKAKPAPDIVFRALALMRVPAEATSMVGDAATDVASAQGADVMAVAATWGTWDEQVLLAAGPDAVARTPADLLALIPAAA